MVNVNFIVIIVLAIIAMGVFVYMNQTLRNRRSDKHERLQDRHDQLMEILRKKKEDAESKAEDPPEAD